MSTKKVLVSFGIAGKVLVCEEDYEALRGLPWRVDPHGYVIRTAGPRGKSRVSLARTIADRAGMPEGTVGFRSGDTLDCTRGNLIMRGGAMRRPGNKTGYPVQPHGVHRKPVTQDRNGGLPPGWLLYYHPGDCTGRVPGAGGCSAEKVLIGQVSRVTGITGPQKGRPGGHIAPRGWTFTAPNGHQARLASFYQGCLFLVIVELFSRIPNPGPRDITRLAALLGECLDESARSAA